jgi:hypothetical protein
MLTTLSFAAFFFAFILRVFSTIVGDFPASIHEDRSKLVRFTTPRKSQLPSQKIGRNLRFRAAAASNTSTGAIDVFGPTIPSTSFFLRGTSSLVAEILRPISRG